MKLKKEQLYINEYSNLDKLWIADIFTTRIESRENVRVITFPSHINRKRVTEITYRFYASEWPALQRVIVPKNVAGETNFYGYDKDPVIEYCDD